MKFKVSIIMFFISLAALTGYAKNVVPVYTWCGEIGWIDTERGTIEDVLAQAVEIEKVLCGEDGDSSEEDDQEEAPNPEP